MREILLLACDRGHSLSHLRPSSAVTPGSAPHHRPPAFPAEACLPRTTTASPTRTPPTPTLPSSTWPVRWGSCCCATALLAAAAPCCFLLQHVLLAVVGAPSSWCSAAEGAAATAPSLADCLQVTPAQEAGGVDEVTFLYKLVDGACPKSYGVNVARCPCCACYAGSTLLCCAAPCCL